MPLARSLLAALVLLACLAPAGAFAQEAPRGEPVTVSGHSGRFLMDDGWLHRRGSSGSWSPVSVPHAWNAGDPSTASMRGGVVWYRKDFRVPERSRSLDWIIRFESVRYRASVWLNGRLVGTHEGGSLPFELRLPNVNRGGANRLLVRVDNRRRTLDLPPDRFTLDGQPSGGWWNYGGITGHVYLRRVNGLDLENVFVRPELACRTCAATIHFRANVRNHGRRRARVRLAGRFGEQPVSLGSRTIGPGSAGSFSGRISVESPHLWSPSDPFLHRVDLDARGGGSSRFSLLSGIRQLTVADGRLHLNHAPVNIRGGFFHEDHPEVGAAFGPAENDALIEQTQALGATMLRSHYPLNQYLLEQADIKGLLIWSEIPVYQVPRSRLRTAEMRRKASRFMRTDILENRNHPSVIAWSVANELDPEPTADENAYYTRMSSLVKGLDPSRLVALATQAYPGAGCQRAYDEFDLIGVNTYFGWYPGPNGTIADRRLLSGYLDQLRACYPNQALMVTEFGAEANRSGPPEVRGTHEFQSEWLDYTLGVYATKPWLSGALVMLREFRARPGWEGGNPRPSPPLHQKGVIDYFGAPKPGADVVSRWYRDTQQYDIGVGQ